jgi:hypothetical protein
MKIKELYLSGMQTTSNAKQVQMNLKQLRYLWKQLNQSVHSSDQQSISDKQPNMQHINHKHKWIVLKAYKTSKC